jgi:hypothetical protein
MNTDTIQRLHDFLLKEEATPLRDSAGIITAAGIDAAARKQAIKDCIKIVEASHDDNLPCV